MLILLQRKRDNVTEERRKCYDNVKSKGISFAEGKNIRMMSTVEDLTDLFCCYG